MTFTYLGALTTDLDTIRFKIGDKVEDEGILPKGANFSDEEINGLLAIEGTVDRTLAALYENLATIYADFVDSKIGPRDEKSSQIAERYGKLAESYRKKFGYASSGVRSGFVTRVDGYSQDIASDEP
jgi:hypothetical protein